MYNFTITQEKIDNVNEILNSNERSSKMKEYLPNFVIENDLVSKVIDTEAKEIVKIHKMNKEIFLQIYPQTCTWAMSYWEEMCGIPTNESLDLEVRRAKLLAKLTQLSVTTPDSIRDAVRNFTNYFNLTIDNKKYFFEVEIDALRTEDIVTIPLKNTIEYMKPAHLAWRLTYLYRFVDNERGNIVTYKHKTNFNYLFSVNTKPREYDDDFNIYEGSVFTFNGLRTFGDNEFFVGRTGIQNTFMRFDGKAKFDGTYGFSGAKDKLRHKHYTNISTVLNLSSSLPVIKQDNNLKQDNVLLNKMELVVKHKLDVIDLEKIRVNEQIKNKFNGVAKMNGSTDFDGWRNK